MMEDDKTIEEPAAEAYGGVDEAVLINGQPINLSTLTDIGQFLNQ